MKHVYQEWKVLIFITTYNIESAHLTFQYLTLMYVLESLSIVVFIEKKLLD